VQAPASQPQAEAPPQPEPTRQEIVKFDTWTLTCNEFAEGPRTRVCSAVTRFYNNQTKQLVFQWTFGLDNNKQLVTVIETLPGVTIPPGIELRIGKSAAHKIPYVICETGVCIAKSNVDANLLRDLTGSPAADVLIQNSQGNPMQLSVPLKGFERAYAVLSKP
jgi:invasion protein IalB